MSYCCLLYTEHLNFCRLNFRRWLWKLWTLKPYQIYSAYSGPQAQIPCVAYRPWLKSTAGVSPIRNTPVAMTIRSTLMLVFGLVLRMLKLLSWHVLWSSMKSVSMQRHWNIREILYSVRLETTSDWTCIPSLATQVYSMKKWSWHEWCSLLPTGVVPIWSAVLRSGRWRWGRLRSATLIEIFPRPQEKTGMWTSRRQLCCFTGTHPANSPWVSGQHSLHNCAWAFSLMCSGQYVAYQPDCRSIRCVPLPYRVSLVPSPLLVAIL